MHPKNIQKRGGPQHAGWGKVFNNRISESADLSFDNHVGDLVDVVEPVGGDGLGLGLPLGEVRVGLGVGQDDLHRGVEGLGDGLPDLGQQPDPDLGLVGDLLGDVVAFERMTYVEAQTGKAPADTPDAPDAAEDVESPTDETVVTVATHEDIDDLNQTVKVRSNPTVLDQTGTAPVGIALLAVSAAAGAGYVLMRKRALSSCADSEDATNGADES